MAEEPGELPASVVQLLEVVNSLEKLELVTRLARDRGQADTAAAYAAQIGVGVDSVKEALEELAVSKLITRKRDGRYQYAPATPELDAAVAELARSYASDPMTMFRAVTQAAMARIRTSAARTFAQAFVIRDRRKPEEPDDA